MPSLPQLPEDASDAFKALQTLTGNSAHLKFAIAGQAYDAISFDGTEALSDIFSATLYVLADMDETWLGKPALVTLTDASGNERTLAGIVTYQRDRGWNANKQARVEILLRPRLWVLSQSVDSRIFQGLSLPDIVRQVILQQGLIATDSMVWKLTQTYPTQPYTVQYEETDLAFIERLLAGIGISYWFTELDGRDIVHFTDDNQHYTPLDLGVIPFIADAGLDKPMACFNKFIHGSRHVRVNAHVVDYTYGNPEHLIKAGLGPTAKDPAQVYFGLGTSNVDQAERRSRILAQRFAIEGLRIEIAGSVAGLYPGATFSFVHPGHPMYSGDYLVTHLSHTLSQQARVEHNSDLGNLAYSHHAYLIRSEERRVGKEC